MNVLKITVAIALHILLHIVSVHLAVAYTVFHIVQHRRELSSLLKKVSFRPHTPQRHASQPVQLVA
ncbi:MAG: hypothetical protein FWD84_01960 [Oscillospiraceae bacterium]|nr:hypothetical protein [Oscillospiraceae bacterium]